MAQGLIEAGVDVLQLRDKQLADRELIDRARRLRQLTRGTSTLLIINDRPDLAALAQADGVHVGQEELSVKDARSIVGAGAVGRRVDAFDRAGAASGARRGELHRRGADVSFRHEAVRSFPGVGVIARGGRRDPLAGLCHRRHYAERIVGQ